MVGILFVCTGNICRSPTAEAVLRHRLQHAGLESRVHTDSVGTHGYHVGQAPDARSLYHASRRGIAMDMLIARKLSHQDYYDYDLLLGMDSGHVRTLETKAPPDATGNVALFLDYAGVKHPRSGSDVPDPYYGGAGDFEHVLQLVEEGVEGLIARLQREWL